MELNDDMFHNCYFFSITKIVGSTILIDSKLTKFEFYRKLGVKNYLITCNVKIGSEGLFCVQVKIVLIRNINKKKNHI